MNGYAVAYTVEEVIHALDDEPATKVVAGGTDLVVASRQGKRELPSMLLGIHRVDELKGINAVAGGLRLGALAVHAEIMAHPEVLQGCTALADGAALVGSPATRSAGTIGGNIVNASPAMDTGAALLVHGAELELRSIRGSRRLPIGELWTGPGATRVGPDEMVTNIIIPAPSRSSGSAYVRLGYRRAMEIAVVGAAAMLVVEDEEVTEARVAITALAPTIRRVPGAEEILTTEPPTDAIIARAAAAVAQAALPIADTRGSAEYRRAMAEVVTRRAIHLALKRARQKRGPVIAASGGQAREER